jgi:hypothetical protein
MEIKGEIRKTRTSLVGGVIIAIFVAILAFLCLGQLGFAGGGATVTAMAIGALFGFYVRLADL